MELFWEEAYGKCKSIGWGHHEETVQRHG